MLRLLLCWLIATVVFSFQSYAQKYPHAVGIEFGGAGLKYDVHYEHQSRNAVLMRIGIGYTPDNIVVPFQLGKMFGNGSHHPEFAAGATYWVNSDSEGIENTIRRHYVMGTVFLGYRYQKPNGRFYIRGGVTPFMQLYTSDPEYDIDIYPWLSAGLGFRF